MVKLVSEKNDREVRLELDDEHGNESGIVVDSFADKQEWDLYKKMEVEHERVVNKHTPEQEANPALILFMTGAPRRASSLSLAHIVYEYVVHHSVNSVRSISQAGLLLLERDPRDGELYSEQRPLYAVVSYFV